MPQKMNALRLSESTWMNPQKKSLFKDRLYAASHLILTKPISKVEASDITFWMSQVLNHHLPERLSFLCTCLAPTPSHSQAPLSSDWSCGGQSPWSWSCREEKTSSTHLGQWGLWIKLEELTGEKSSQLYSCYFFYEYFTSQKRENSKKILDLGGYIPF